MLIEIAVLSALSPVAEADVASPPHLDYSLPEMVAPPMAAPNSSAMADLEMVRFDVQDPQPLSHIPDDMCNVMVARGTRETLPLHLFAGTEAPTIDAIVDFAHTVCRNVPPPPLVAHSPMPEKPSAAARIYYQAQREVSKKVAAPGHQASGRSTKCDDEETWHHLRQPATGCRNMG